MERSLELGNRRCRQIFYFVVKFIGEYYVSYKKKSIEFKGLSFKNSCRVWFSFKIYFLIEFCCPQSPILQFKNSWEIFFQYFNLCKLCLIFYL